MLTGDLSTLRFDTAGLDEGDRRGAYLDRLDGILETTFLSDRFSARMDAFQLGALSVLTLDASPRRSRRTATRIAHDRYDSIGVQYIVAGVAQGDAGGRAVDSTPGTIMLLDYGQPFDIADRTARNVVNVAVPRAMVPAVAGGVGELHGRVMEAAAAHALAALMATFPAALETLPGAAGPILARVFLELLAIALECYPDDRGDTVSARDRVTISQAERLVDGRLGSAELGPAWLTAKLGMSRSELYSIMERFGGVSRFIASRRLRGARVALEAEGETRRIGEIAFAFGFASEAHFARSFRAAYGMTASEARQSAKATRAAYSVTPRRRRTD